MCLRVFLLLGLYVVVVVLVLKDTAYTWLDCVLQEKRIKLCLLLDPRDEGTITKTASHAERTIENCHRMHTREKHTTYA